jgi:hypothetical protein
MQSGACAGVSGSGDCLRSGWSPYWLPPLAFAAQVDSLLSSLDEIVCPFCITERAVGVLPGFNRAKANRVIAALSGLNCMQVGHPQPSAGHTHLFDFVNENMANMSRSNVPAQGERGY